MIYDRTIEDVNQAKQIVENIIKIKENNTFEGLTDDQISTLERGMLTLTTINRIENKQTEIRELLNEAGYYNNAGDNTLDWEQGNYFMQADLERLATNSALLRNSIKVYADTPEAPKPVYHFVEINKMEKILVDLETLIGDLESNYRECGTFSCGE